MGLEIINQRKKLKKMTNEELAVLSGVPKGTIDKITSGATKDPKLETLKHWPGCWAVRCLISTTPENLMTRLPRIKRFYKTGSGF